MSAIIDAAERIRNQVDIVSVVEGYVGLRNAGANHKGLCPFHREKTPSFNVSPSKQIFHCFGCGKGGDVIKFIQLIERLEWIEALKFLAEKYRISLPELDKPRRAGEKDERAQLVDAAAFAARIFRDELKKSCAAGNPVADYLKRRQIDAALIERFALGLASEQWTGLLDAAGKAGHTKDTLVKAGLVIFNTQRNRHYDRFRNRIIFPICDTLSRPVAFGGRVYAADAGKDEPKYINSPETPVYKKAEVLYALHLAKEEIASRGYALLTEGYMDVIRAHQHGFTNAIASCGTALTLEQARLLRKYCKSVVFVYDGDEAGQKAMLRGTEVLLEEDFEVRVVALPQEHDPDSFLCERGAPELQRLIQTAPLFFDHFLAQALQKHDARTAAGKVQIVDALLPLLKKVRQSIIQHELCKRLADRLHLETRLIERQLKGGSRNRKQLEAAASNDLEAELKKTERYLLKLVLESSSARVLLLDRVEPDWLAHPVIRKWFTYCRGESNTPDKLCWNHLFTFCDEGDAAFLRDVALDSGEGETLDDSEQTVRHLLARLEFRYRRERSKALALQIEEFYQGESADEHLSHLTRELDAWTPVRSLGNEFFRQQT